MRKIKTIFSTLMSLIIILTFSTTALAAETPNNMVASEYAVINVNEDVELRLNIDIIESRSNDIVHALAYGAFYFTGTTTKISQYGMDVAFLVNDNNTSHVDSGGGVSLYHNSAHEDYSATYDNLISGENTSKCSVTGLFEIEKNSLDKNEADIKLTLTIDSNGDKSMNCSGNFGDWEVIW
ncbi:MAG: hypothetical protein R3Y24_16610 [Eubacteriales bacterium]